MLRFSVPLGYRRRERPASRKLRPSMAWIDAILECDSRVLRYLCMLKTPKGREGVEILRRQRPGQLRLFSTDQLLWVWLYWRWRSRHLGRPLIRRMSLANPLWGAPASTANCSSSASTAALRSIGRPVLLRSVLIRHMLVLRTRTPGKRPGQCFQPGPVPDVGRVDIEDARGDVA
jgi:hypothetical protein